MGMYTELDFHSELKKDTPQDVIDLIDFAVNRYEHKDGRVLPDHPFFKCERWPWLFCGGGSCYFDAKPHYFFKRDEISESWTLGIRTNIKNYSNEIALFVEWITPYLYKEPGDFIGFSRYEENDNPTLLYHPNTWKAPPQ